MGLHRAGTRGTGVVGELVVKIVFMGVAPIVFTFLGMRPRPREQWRYWGVGLALLGVVFLGLAFVVPREVRALVTPFLLLSPSAKRSSARRCLATATRSACPWTCACRRASSWFACSIRARRPS